MWVLFAPLTLREGKTVDLLTSHSFEQILEHCLRLPDGGSLTCLVRGQVTNRTTDADLGCGRHPGADEGSCRTPIYQFAISFDCRKPLGIPALSVRKTVALQSHLTEVAMTRHLGKKACLLDRLETVLPEPSHGEGSAESTMHFSPTTAYPSSAPIDNHEFDFADPGSPLSPSVADSDLGFERACDCRICGRATRDLAKRGPRDRLWEMWNYELAEDGDYDDDVVVGCSTWALPFGKRGNDPREK